MSNTFAGGICPPDPFRLVPLSNTRLNCLRDLATVAAQQIEPFFWLFAGEVRYGHWGDVAERLNTFRPFGELRLGSEIPEFALFAGETGVIAVPPVCAESWHVWVFDFWREVWGRLRVTTGWAWRERVADRPTYNDAGQVVAKAGARSKAFVPEGAHAADLDWADGVLDRRAAWDGLRAAMASVPVPDVGRLRAELTVEYRRAELELRRQSPVISPAVSPSATATGGAKRPGRKSLEEYDPKRLNVYRLLDAANDAFEPAGGSRKGRAARLLCRLQTAPEHRQLREAVDSAGLTLTPELIVRASKCIGNREAKAGKAKRGRC